MGPELFDYGYGPFRWVCLSGKHEDLVKTDRAAMECIDPNRRGQDLDNYNWIRDAEKNNLVVGAQARMPLSGCRRAHEDSLALLEMVRRGEVGPLYGWTNHHDLWRRGFPVPRNLQHKRRQQRHGGYGPYSALPETVPVA